MNEELLDILEHIEREKGISKEVLFKALESALVSAAKKILGKDVTDIIVGINRETGKIKVSSDGKEIKSDEFGRIAAQTAKQVIIQKIREAERDVILEEYQKRTGGIASGMVHRFERGNIIVDLGKIEGILPRNEQSPNERYNQGDSIRSYIKEVNKTSHGPQIILSRADSGFVKKLFELEVPEIAQDIVRIKAIAREPGERTKMAVCSSDEKIDPVGACVGMRGTRVKDVVRELRGERIDIVRWSEDIKEYLKAAISPAEARKITIDQEKKTIELIVKNDQLSIAIGKHGQNVRLASKLIGWEIDVRGEEEKEEEKKRPEKIPSKAERGKVKGEKAKEEKVKKEKKRPKGVPGEAEGKKKESPAKLEGIGKKTMDELVKAGFDTISKIAGLKVEDLIKLEGIGKKKAEKILASAKEMVKK